MNNYNDFVKEAIQDYDKLPQETSELYKRHYINLPFDLKKFLDNQNNQQNGALKSTLEGWPSAIGIKFDVAIGSKDFFLPKSNDLVRVERNEKLGALLLDEKMHKN